MASTAKSSAERAKAFRERQKAKGLRLVRMWVVDTTSDDFRKQAKADARAIAMSEHEAEDQAFVDAISEWNDPGSATWWQPPDDAADR